MLGAFLWNLFFLGSAAAMFYATWHGAHLCQEEAKRAGHPELWNTGPGWGLKPKNWRVYAAAAAGEVVFTVLAALGHPHAAAEFMQFAGFFQYGLALATWWAGCC